MRVNRALMTFAILAAMSGCASPPTRFYALESDIGTPQTAALLVNVPPTHRPGCRGILGPVTLPSLIDRPQLVVRRGLIRVDILEHERWAEPLRDAIPRIVLDSLRQAAPDIPVGVVAPTDPAGRTITTTLDVGKFDFQTDGVVIEVRGVIGSKPMGASREWSTEVREAASSPNNDYGAQVLAASRGLEQIGRQLAELFKGECRVP